MNRRFARPLKQLCLMMFVLCAQHTALTHAIWHLSGGERESLVHTQANEKDAGAHGESSPGEREGELCIYHAAFGETLGSALPATPLILTAAALEVAHDYTSSGTLQSEAIIALARGPPTLL